jgi:hypothetical protein
VGCLRRVASLHERLLPIPCYELEHVWYRSRRLCGVRQVFQQASADVGRWWLYHSQRGSLLGRLPVLLVAPTLLIESLVQTYETAVALNTDIADELPFNDYFEYFGPDFRLHIRYCCKEQPLCSIAYSTLEPALATMRIKTAKNIWSSTSNRLLRTFVTWPVRPQFKCNV